MIDIDRWIDRYLYIYVDRWMDRYIYMLYCVGIYNILMIQFLIMNEVRVFDSDVIYLVKC